MTPQTAGEWRQALAAAHPDRGGDPEAFLRLSAAREAWRQAQARVCPRCPCACPPKRRYCSPVCARQAHAEARRKPRALRTGGAMGGACVYCGRRQGTEQRRFGWIHPRCVASMSVVAKRRDGKMLDGSAGY